MILSFYQNIKPKAGYIWQWFPIWRTYHAIHCRNFGTKFHFFFIYSDISYGCITI